MNRRLFLKRALTGAAVAGAAVAVVASQMPFESLMSPGTSVSATINEYVDYSNFSTLAISQSMEEAFQKCAIELGYRRNQSISELYAATLDSYEPVAFGRMA